MTRRGERRKGQRRSASAGVYTGPERRSGKDRRKAAAKQARRSTIAQAKSLIALVIILAAACGALHYWTSSPSNARASELLTMKFRYSGVDLIVVEGRGFRVYLELEYKEVVEKSEAELSPLLRDIAEQYDTLTGREMATFYIYVGGKLTRKVKQREGEDAGD